MDKAWTGQTFLEKKPVTEAYEDQHTLAKLLEQEEDMLSQLPLPGVPKDERARRKAWNAIPQRYRAAIRRLHKQFGHCPRGVLIALIKAAKLPSIYLEAARTYKCNACETVTKPPQTSKVALPKPYVFNHTVGIDILGVELERDIETNIKLNQKVHSSPQPM